MLHMKSFCGSLRQVFKRTTCSCSWKKYKNIQSTNDKDFKFIFKMVLRLVLNLKPLVSLNSCSTLVLVQLCLCRTSFSVGYTISNIFAHRLTWLKTQCSTVQRWSSVAWYIFLVSFCIYLADIMVAPPVWVVTNLFPCPGSCRASAACAASHRLWHNWVRRKNHVKAISSWIHQNIVQITG